MACTVGVETAICDHYNDQLREIIASPLKSDTELKEVTPCVRGFETPDDQKLPRRRGGASQRRPRARGGAGASFACAHMRRGCGGLMRQAPLYELMTASIKSACRAAIWLSERV
jgi:demethoxyubiquinone hydroxylase (CLK1/Coq7/Cat5 family)